MQVFLSTHGYSLNARIAWPVTGIAEADLAFSAARRNDAVPRGGLNLMLPNGDILRIAGRPGASNVVFLIKKPIPTRGSNGTT